MIQTPLDILKIRGDFPILNQLVYDKPLVYLDNAASTQKPQAVIDGIAQFYANDYANVHRGVHYLSERATNCYEAAREKIRKFINAESKSEIIFVRGTTEAINLVAQSFGRLRLQAGDEILITTMEHHANIVPWQLICEQTGATLCVVPIDADGGLLLDDMARLMSKKTKLLAITHISNALGCVNPIKDIIAMAHAKGIPVLVDGAQAVPHVQVDVQALDCDFYAFSGHKMYGPSGIGVLYGKTKWLEEMPPYQGGGEMVLRVTFEKTTYNRLPYKFEAGSPHITGAVGLGYAIDYLESQSLAIIHAYEQALLNYASASISAIPGVRIIGTTAAKIGVLSFVIDGVHPHDVGTILDRQGIAIRAGHHCAMPLMQYFKVPATIRASFAFYNTEQEVDALAAGIHKVKEIFT